MSLQTIRGKKLWVEVDGEGEPIVFIHGLGSSVNYYQVQAKALSERGFKCIRLDSEGSGRSMLQGADLTVDSMAKDVVALMDLLDIKVLFG
jgi:pimeloyl-ACP methyl ester carboxylesterase